MAAPEAEGLSRSSNTRDLVRMLYEELDGLAYEQRPAPEAIEVGLEDLRRRPGTSCISGGPNLTVGSTTFEVLFTL